MWAPSVVMGTDGCFHMFISVGSEIWTGVADLHQVWKQTATAWLVSDYLLLPDHLHLFCAPRDLRFTIERWIALWKDRFAKTHPDTGTFQAGGFHHRLRSDESHAQK